MDELMGNKMNDVVDALPLRRATLSQLPEAIERPTYTRADLTPGIVHIGLGNFHRAHQAWYLHRLMQAGEARDWAIIGAGVRAYDAAMRDRLAAQDYLTTLIELTPTSVSDEVIGPMIDYLPIEDGNGPLIEAMGNPAIRIVSLTVTEGGYYIDPATHGFDATHEDIIFDAANPTTPRTAFGAIIAALRARRDAGVPAFTVQSCDNLQGNGEIARQTVLGLAGLSDPALARWIEANSSFPNSMVDCIVPATGPTEIALAHSFGIDDAAPVSHENYRQWVIEDAFCAGRPAWENVGATLTDDVHSFEAMKIRILNGGHQVIANVGELLGCTTIADCIADPDIAAFFHRVENDGIVPYVHDVPGMTPAAYVDLIQSRFANSAIKDTVRRVAFDGSSRHTGFILPIVREAVAVDGSVEALALVEALWARMCAGTREDGSVIEPNDPFWADLNACALEAKTRPAAWLEQSHMYGDLADHPAFSAAFTNWLTAIWADGSRATLQAFTA